MRSILIVRNAAFPDKSGPTQNVYIPSGSAVAVAVAVALDLDLDLDLGRPIKPRWPEFDIDSAGEPAWMPV